MFFVNIGETPGLRSQSLPPPGVTIVHYYVSKLVVPATRSPPRVTPEAGRSQIRAPAIRRLTIAF